MEGYRGGALGFKAASFHAIGANKRRYPPAPVLFFGRYRETATSANTKKAGLDTAALIAELDLAISVDCVISHLAGAMGKPVWILLAPTRDPEDNPWYPTAFFAPSANGRRLEGRH